MNKKLFNILIILLIFLVFMYVYSSIFFILKYILKLFIPFIIAFMLAYIIQPIVVYFKKFLKKRVYAVILSLVLFLMITYSIISLTLPHFINEVKEFLSSYNDIITKIENFVNEFSLKFDFLPDDYQPTFDNLRIIIDNYLQKNEFDPIKIISKIVDYIGILVIIPTTLIYLLLDYENIICKFRNKLIEKNMIRLKDFLQELNKFIQTYIKTTFLIMFILTFITSFAFFIVGLDFPIFFGIIVSVTNIIPYLGPYIGGILPVFYALLDSFEKALVVFIVIVIIQLIESNILSPFLYSKHNKIHPILIILGLIIFGKLFGILGMLFSVPLIGAIKITLKHYPIKFKKELNNKN